MSEVVAPDRKAQRREERRIQNRRDILDAAERVFGEDGIHHGSLRRIAEESGFSTAAIYMFFENKQHLLSETLVRRGDELVARMRLVVQSNMTPLEKLHGVVDTTIAFFDERPHFRLLLRHIRGGPTITGPVLAEFSLQPDNRFEEAMTLVSSLFVEGQQSGAMRRGSPQILGHLYSILVNEFILLDVTPGDAVTDELTTEEFHALIDAAFGADISNSRP
jgi:AcrR family transcriptional regulator